MFKLGVWAVGVFLILNAFFGWVKPEGFDDLSEGKRFFWICLGIGIGAFLQLGAAFSGSRVLVEHCENDKEEKDEENEEESKQAALWKNHVDSLNRVRSKLLSLSASERDALRELALQGSLTGDQIRAKHPEADFIKINNKVGMMQYNDQTDEWFLAGLERFNLFRFLVCGDE